MTKLSALKSIRAFTIVEMLLVVTIISVITIPLFVTYRSSRTNQALRTSAEQLANTLRAAHVLAREAKDSKNWGVVSQGEKQYALVYGKDSDYRVSSVVSLESGVALTDSFSVWYGIGTGESEDNTVVSLVAQNDRQVEINILKTGVVETREL